MVPRLKCCCLRNAALTSGGHSYARKTSPTRDTTDAPRPFRQKTSFRVNVVRKNADGHYLLEFSGIPDIKEQPGFPGRNPVATVYQPPPTSFRK